MSRRIDLTAERARELFAYDPQTGAFTWKVNRRRARAGAPAGGRSSEGYVVIKLEGKSIKAHRLAWLIVTGQWPEHEIDHANGVKDDNRFDNLRDATKGQNNANSRIYSSNRTGLKGVHWCNTNRKFIASIRVNRKLRHLGAFDDKHVAHAAYAVAAKQAHGEFARTN